MEQSLWELLILQESETLDAFAKLCSGGFCQVLWPPSGFLKPESWPEVAPFMAHLCSCASTGGGGESFYGGDLAWCPLAQLITGGLCGGWPSVLFGQALRLL